MSCPVDFAGRCLSCGQYVPTSAGCDCTRVVRHDLFGIPTDFEIKHERIGDAIKITVSYVPPRLEWDRANNYLRVFPSNQSS